MTDGDWRAFIDTLGQLRRGSDETSLLIFQRSKGLHDNMIEGCWLPVQVGGLPGVLRL